MGVGFLGILIREYRRPDDDDLSSYIAYGVRSVMNGALISGTIDLLINEPIHERPSQTPRVTLAHMCGRERMGLTSGVSF